MISGQSGDEPRRANCADGDEPCRANCADGKERRRGHEEPARRATRKATRSRDIAFRSGERQKRELRRAQLALIAV